MRYYLGTCEYKWSHTAAQGNEHMENIWVRREIGEDLYNEISQKNYTLVLLHSNGIVEDIFCRCDIYVDIKNERQALLFGIKHTKAKRIEKTL